MKMENKKTITIAHLAKLLEIKKINGQSIVLFLGSRAGGLFLNETFYSYIERLSTSDTMFNKLTVLEKFSESYRVLNELTESSIFDVLYGFLKNIPFYRRGDECLVELLL